MSELIAIQYQQFDMLGDECVTDFRGFADPMTVCSMTGIAKRAIDQRNIVLIFSQNGNRYALTPVQMRSLRGLRKPPW
jgi:hypothetical protein